MRSLVVVTVALAGAALGLPAQADAPPPASAADHRLTLTADSPRRGWIRLHRHSTPGVPVTITELLPQGGSEPLAELTPTAADTAIERAAPWRCDRRERW